MVKGKPDYLLSILVFALMIFGVIMVSSASVVKSYDVTGGQTNNLYLYRQLTAVGIGVLAWIIIQRIDYHFYKKYYPWFLVASVVLLSAVFLPFIGKDFGANRWIGIGSFVFQPSEIVKLFIAIFLAGWFAKEEKVAGSFWRGFIPFLLVTGIVAFLIVWEPDLGTTVVILAIALSIYFVAGANLWHLAAISPFAIGAIWILIKTSSYRWERFLTFLNPEKDVLGIGYHVNQAIIAIGSGGLWGLGFGNSMQKFNYLPEAASDSIFAIICEELGFVRALLVVLVFILIAVRGYGIAKRVPDSFGKYLATGITTWFSFQAFVNLAAMIGVLPLTGVPLPFVSYGGTSLVISLVGLAVLLNISKHAYRTSAK